jgi:multiple sugar transport system permease protein
MRDVLTALAALPLTRFFLNTVLFAACAVVAQVGTSAAAGYAFARLRFPGRERLFAAVLALVAVPAIVLLVPRFLMIDAFGWVDSYPGLVSTELVSAWGIFLLRQCFLALPRDLEDAARLDGAGEWAVFWRIALPSARPALAALAVIAFVQQWKSFLWPLVVMRSPERQVAEVGLVQLSGAYHGNWPYQLAVAAAAALPTLIVYVVAHRYFVRGVELTAAVGGGTATAPYRP